MWASTEMRWLSAETTLTSTLLQANSVSAAAAIAGMSSGVNAMPALRGTSLSRARTPPAAKRQTPHCPTLKAMRSSDLPCRRSEAAEATSWTTSARGSPWVSSSAKMNVKEQVISSVKPRRGTRIAKYSETTVIATRASTTGESLIRSGIAITAATAPPVPNKDTAAT